MKMSSLIDETVEKLKSERIYVCYQKLYKPIYEHLISEQCKSRIEILQVDDMEYTELKEHLNVLNEQDLLILIMPFYVSGTDSEIMHNLLINLEKKGVYFINISAGVEGIKFTNKAQKLYNKLLFEILEHNSARKINENIKRCSNRLIVGKKFRIIDEYGSNIEFIVESVLIENIPLTPKQRVIQIPYGEVFIVPSQGSVNGVFVHKIKEKTSVYQIKKDFVDLKELYYQGHFPICEIGFGMNELVPDIDALPYLEKRNNTYHLGIGENSNFGGNYKYNFHIDLVQNKAKWILEMLDEP